MDTLFDTFLGLAIGFIISKAFSFLLYRLGDQTYLFGKKKVLIQARVGLYGFLGTAIFAFFFMGQFPETGLIACNTLTGFGLFTVLDGFKHATKNTTA